MALNIFKFMTKSDPNVFSPKTKEILAKKASQVCSKCKRNTSGGNADPQKATMVGEQIQQSRRRIGF